jgi:hypothetical protein
LSPNPIPAAAVDDVKYDENDKEMLIGIMFYMNIVKKLNICSYCASIDEIRKECMLGR